MLKDIVIAHETVTYGDTEFQMRGLSLTDIGKLITGHREPIEQLMESRMELDGIANHFPEFMAQVIAYGAGEPDMVDTVKTLPFGIQLEAFERCWDLTLPDYAALEKLVARIKGVIPNLQGKTAST